MKITRAMELIATARIGKAQVRVAQAKPYTQKMNEVIRNIASSSGSVTHPLLERREVATVGVLVVTSDRGLAGGYNTSVIRMAEHAIAEHEAAGRVVKVFTVGAKSLSYFRYRKYIIDHSWLDITDTPVYADARAIANTLLDEYAGERVDAVEAYTTEYVSALTQTPELLSLLPITPPEEEGDADEAEAVQTGGYTYEPSPVEILSRLLPRYLEGAVFSMLLDASASEHAARRRAMKAATENAHDLTRLLTREVNQARQAEITTEISEIVGGAEALSNA